MWTKNLFLQPCVIDVFLREELFANAHNLFQEHVNEIDFDYMEYAKQRFQEYWLKKPKVLGS